MLSSNIVNGNNVSNIKNVNNNINVKSNDIDSFYDSE